MDPAAIIGISGVAVQLVGLLGKSIRTLSDLRGRWNDADLLLFSLQTQLVTLRAALIVICQWMEANGADESYLLRIELDGSFQCCRMLLNKVDLFLSEIDSYDFNIPTLQRSKNDSESLYVLRGIDSFWTQAASVTSGISSKLSVVFEFDRELFTTKVYSIAHRSAVVAALRSRSRAAHHRMEFADKVSPHIALGGKAGELAPRNGRAHNVWNKSLRLRENWKVWPGTPLPTEEYSYQPLRGFRNVRLLELFPGDRGNPLEGTIRETPLEGAGEFRALSYRWESSRETYAALATAQGRVPLTPSLYTALRRLRNAKCPSILWVDAICINQEDEHEMQAQLCLKNEIFRSAEEVVAWLGDETEGSDRAVEALSQIRTLALRLPTWPLTFRSVPESWHERSCPDDQDEVWACIEAFLTRKWFESVWVLQEIVFASSIIVLCGDWMIDWDTMFGAFKICVQERPRLLEDSPRQPGRPTPLAAYTLGITREAYLGPLKKRFGLLELFELFSYTRATKTLDKLFALRLLASDADDPAFDPDYGTPLEGVVRRYATAFVARGSALELLYRAGISKSFEFSSWIPHWTGEEYPRTISTWDSGGGRFSTAGDTRTRACISDVDKKVLIVSGVFIDRIVSVGTVTWSDSDAVEYVNALQQAVTKLTSYPTKESVDQLMTRLPIGDASRPHLDALTGAASAYRTLTNWAEQSGQASSDTDWRGKKEEWSKFNSEVGNMKSVGDFLGCVKQGGEHRQNMWEYWHTASSFSQRLSGAKFCTTERGYAGLVPRHAVSGDAVVIIHGAAVPFLVRERESKDGAGGQKTLIGECYIHGIMHGEALKFKGIREEEIHLV
ncbi:hypothetical protein DL767_008599 [Monosporascus sp. MG133]|nr:hypothetical protein DL767_008599 [Monosporascus sp. MG133]